MREATLSDLCSLVTDGTHDTPKPQRSGYPLIKGKDIAGGVIDFTHCDHISRADHERVIARSKTEFGDTLFANIGSIGDTAYVNTTREFSIKNVALFKPNPHVILGRYLYYIVAGPRFQSMVTSARTGSAQPFLSLKQLRQQVIQYHEALAEQQRVMEILSAYDDLIENNARRIAILEEMAAAIYREWFIEFRFPGHEGVPLVDSELGTIPEGWRWSELGEYSSEIRAGVEPKDVDPDTPYFGLEHLPEQSIAIQEWGRAMDVSSRKFRFSPGDILFGKIRPYFHKVGIPPVIGICSTDAVVVRPRSEEVSGLVLAVVSSDPFVQHAVQTSQGTKMPRANWPVMERFKVPVPADLGPLKRLNAFVMDNVRLIHVLILQNRNLRQTRDLLLPRLISGEIDVSNLDIGDAEPAA